jgi:hypothetical protein
MQFQKVLYSNAPCLDASPALQQLFRSHVERWMTPFTKARRPARANGIKTFVVNAEANEGGSFGLSVC